MLLKHDEKPSERTQINDNFFQRTLPTTWGKFRNRTGRCLAAYSYYVSCVTTWFSSQPAGCIFGGSGRRDNLSHSFTGFNTMVSFFVCLFVLYGNCSHYIVLCMLIGDMVSWKRELLIFPKKIPKNTLFSLQWRLLKIPATIPVIQIEIYGTVQQFRLRAVFLYEWHKILQ